MNLEIGKEEITIKLSRKNSEQPIIIRNGKKVSFDKLDDARNYISELIFAKLDGNSVPSFRNLFSILMRDERSKSTDILKLRKYKKY